MASRARTLAGVAVALGVATGVLWMQWRSDMARAKEGREIVAQYLAPASSVGLDRIIRSWHPGMPMEWSGRTESAWRDQVRVTAAVTISGETTHRYEFLVDVNTHQIAPGNELGRRAIAALAPSASASR